ncbi:bifunctional phosphopantothenoylcysteine decarboxylase/phosphopantothenate--cysteine ligase CoaBC [uncultured Allofournierella sp.]|uniref:bifunctional phosphopantothenoylcysteine decarboxylase/phosphopantothenate--cysteine ligase CoaBC n=1 Tax=uncultured Allofournierella sp. TaxID=1940258 RepID=UPI003752850A
MLRGKHIVLAVTGGIAAYKMASMASMLVKQGAQVQVLMTQNATNFINPITFETLTGRKCLIDTFDRNFQFEVEHISVAKWADLVLVAPASANVIAKLAHGLADDMLTTTLLACKCKKLVAPAMNTNMYENPAVQENLATLVRYGMELIEPVSGHLACGDTGMGKMVEPEVMLEHILRHLAMPHTMEGLRVLVTAGPTQEAIDPVRFITNHSTGTMGYALARICMLRGAQVTLVTGPTSLTPPPFVEVVPVVSAQQMYQEVTARSQVQDIVIKAAAVADFRPAQTAEHKIKKDKAGLSIQLESTQDILRQLGSQKKPGQFLCGFAMETQDLEQNALRKLETKQLDLVVANNLKVEGAGFGTGTNVVTLLWKDGKKQLERMEKQQVAVAILDQIMELRS